MQKASRIKHGKAVSETPIFRRTLINALRSDKPSGFNLLIPRKACNCEKQVQHQQHQNQNTPTIHALHARENEHKNRKHH